MTNSIIVYDCEIVKAIAKRNEEKHPDIDYVIPPPGGSPWRCFDQMGISVICAFDYEQYAFRVFCRDNFNDFQHLLHHRDVHVTFNGVNFDNELLRVNGIQVYATRQYDLLRELWRAADLNPDTFDFRTHTGFGLDDTAKAQFLPGKTGHGALAPVDWQRGNVGRVIDYCLQDVWLTKQLFDMVLRREPFNHPRDTSSMLYLRHPDDLFLATADGATADQSHSGPNPSNP